MTYKLEQICRDEGAIKVFCHPGIPYDSIFKWGITKKIRSSLQDDKTRFYIRCSTALWKGLGLLQLKVEDRILFPSYHCGVELDVLRQAGFHTDYYEVDAKLNIDWADIEHAVTTQTKVLYLIHYFGFPHDMTKILEFCSRHNLLLIEDCAVSLHARYQEQEVGTFGNIAIYSMRKTIALPAGGALRINDSTLSLPPKDKSRILYELMKTFYLILMRDFVRSRLGSKILTIFNREKQAPPPGTHGADNPYFNQKWKNGGMSMISLFLLRQTSPQTIYERRRQNFQELLEASHKCKHVRPLIDSLQEGACPLVFLVTVSYGTSDFLQFCRARGVNADRYWPEVHRDFPIENFHESQWLKENVIALPVHQNLSKSDLALVKCTILKWESHEHRQSRSS